VRFRAARSGNRQLNAALYRIAITQIRVGPGRAYYQKRRAAGDSHREPLRRLERRIARKVYRHLQADRTKQNDTTNVELLPWQPKELEVINVEWSCMLAELQSRYT
jgi:transposase